MQLCYSNSSCRRSRLVVYEPQPGATPTAFDWDCADWQMAWSVATRMSARAERRREVRRWRGPPAAARRAGARASPQSRFNERSNMLTRSLVT